MASVANRMKGRRPAARLYLATPLVSDPAGLRTALSQVLDAAAVAAVLLRLPAGDDRALIDRVKSVAPLVQDQGVALLLEDHHGIVARSGADGAHVTGIDQFRAAAPTLKPERIAGCGCLKTRHDAMVAGEAGADYVMFGEPDPDQRRPSLASIVERIGWWAELFEVPCVGFAGSADEVAPLAAAGADFVALGEWVFGHEREPAATIADAARRLAEIEVAA